MQNYLARNDLERLQQNINMTYSTLTDAYQDARQAIDGLRLGPDENGLAGWLEQTVSEFEETSGLSEVVLETDVRRDLPSEVHAQLIRIVQEALSNIRKHSQARNVWIGCHETNDDLWLEIRDDGQGFSPEDIPGPSQHGMRGMRERAELIGADFQVTSRQGEGTVIRVRLPLLSLKMGTISQ
jgi:two-component system nitrate/nitrite sensor histidine kinase NarX